MKFLYLVFIPLFIGCSPKTQMITQEKSTDTKPITFEKTEYRFFENGEWVLDNPDEIPESNKDFWSVMYRSLVYPAAARKNGVQGTVIIEVIQNEVGQIIDSQIKQDLAPGCGEEALKALRKAAQTQLLTPIYKDGKARKTKHNIPITFRLH